MAQLVAVARQHGNKIGQRQRAHRHRQAVQVDHLGDHAAVLGGQKVGVGVIGEVQRWIERGGAVAQGKGLAQLAAPKVCHLRQDGDGVFGVGQVVAAQVEKLLGGIHLHTQVGDLGADRDVLQQHLGRDDRGHVEDHIFPGVWVLTPGRVAAGNGQRRDGDPGGGLLHVNGCAAQGSRPGAQGDHIGCIALQKGSGREGEGGEIGIPGELPGGRAAAPGRQREIGLHAFGVHHLVEGQPDGGVEGHASDGIGRLDRHQARGGRAERPGEGRFQRAAANPSQRGVDLGGIGRAAGQGRLRVEDVGAGVDPFAAPGGLWLQGEACRQPGRIGAQGHHRTVEGRHHSRGGVHFNGTGGRQHLRHLQVTGGVVIHLHGHQHRHAALRLGSGGNVHRHAASGQEGRIWLEAQRRVAQPVEAARQDRLAAERPFHRGAIHGLVEVEGDRPIQGQLRAGQGVGL